MKKKEENFMNILRKIIDEGNLGTDCLNDNSDVLIKCNFCVKTAMKYLGYKDSRLNTCPCGIIMTKVKGKILEAGMSDHIKSEAERILRNYKNRRKTPKPLP